MNELLYNLAAVTGEARWQRAGAALRPRAHLRAARRADATSSRGCTSTPRSRRSSARRAATSSPARLRQRDVAEYFWHTVTERRCYCTGGTSNGEAWNTPTRGAGARALGLHAGVLRHLQHAEAHAPRVRLDRRRACSPTTTSARYYNGILGVQHPGDGNEALLRAARERLLEAVRHAAARFLVLHGQHVPSRSPSSATASTSTTTGVYVNLFVPSELDWAERGVRLAQDTRFPEEDTVRLTVLGARPARFALHVRVPYWTAGGSISLNGTLLPGPVQSGGYFTLERRWSKGDVLSVHLPMQLHAAPMPDDPSVAGGDVWAAGAGGAARVCRAHRGKSARRTHQPAQGSGVRGGAYRCRTDRGPLARSVELVAARGRASVGIQHHRSGKRPHARSPEPHL